MTASQIAERFAELGEEISTEDVESRLKVLTDTFKVPESDAISSVVSYFLRSTGIERSDYYAGSGGNQDVSIADLPHEDGQWVNIRVKLVDLWDTTSEHITQSGIIGDDTGKIKFVLWKNAGLDEMELDKSYILENVVTNLYNDRISITLNKTSVITEIDDDIEVGYAQSEYTGVMVQIKVGSGLIKRCPECNRALQSGACSEHGNVEGINDLRIMAVMDNGIDTQDVLFNCEMTESIWGHTLDEAISMAIDELDAGAVIESMRNDLVGRYYSVVGNAMDTTVLVNSFEVM